MDKILAFRTDVEDYLESYLRQNPGKIYDPVRYITDLGGKRLRPCLLLAIGESLGADIDHTLPLAAAVEIFHNFTLLHDDIMDQADTRRGRPAVHVKWNRDQAILSGDIMFAMTFELLLRSALSNRDQALQLLTRTAKEVCIGQQMDMEFENRNEVVEGEYLEMIRLKTSVLIGASAALGAMASGADQAQVSDLYRFGEQLGLSFQIQDDILDTFGDKASVGKRIGGDILQNKKTLLYIRTRALCSNSDRAILDRWAALEIDSQEKIEEVRAVMSRCGALDSLRETQKGFLDEATRSLKNSNVKGEWLEAFSDLATHQLARSS